jgi:hypothetical protein
VDEQILQRYLEIFAVESIRFVTADRKFACAEWLEFLNQGKIPFCLRIKSSALITDKRGRRMKAGKTLRTARVGEAVVCLGQRKMCGVAVSVAAMRKADGDNVLVICVGHLICENGRWSLVKLLFAVAD